MSTFQDINPPRHRPAPPQARGSYPIAKPTGAPRDLAPRPRRPESARLGHLRKLPADQPRAHQPPEPHQPPAMPAVKTAAPKQRSSPKSYAATVALAIALGLLAQFQAIGIIIILIYTVASVVWRISSRKTFTLALLSVGATALALLIGRWIAAKNFAAYSFLLFVAGTLSLCIEQGRLSKMLRKEHQMLQTSTQDANVKKPY